MYTVHIHIYSISYPQIRGVLVEWTKTVSGNQEDTSSNLMKDVYSKFERCMDMHGKDNVNSYWACGDYSISSASGEKSGKNPPLF
jgi:hypothetical protein